MYLVALTEGADSHTLIYFLVWAPFQKFAQKFIWQLDGNMAKGKDRQRRKEKNPSTRMTWGRRKQIEDESKTALRVREIKGHREKAKDEREENWGKDLQIHSSVEEKYIITQEGNSSLSCLIRSPVKRHATMWREEDKDEWHAEYKSSHRGQMLAGLGHGGNIWQR